MDYLYAAAKLINDNRPTLFKISIPLAAVGLASGIYYSAYRYVHKYRGIFKDIGVPYVEPESWLGMFETYLEKDMDVIDEELIQKYGNVFGVFEGRQPVLMVADPDLIRQVLVKDFDSFTDHRSLIRRRPINFVMSALTGARWKNVRKQVTHAFTPKELKRMMPLILKTVDQLVSNVEKYAKRSTSVDVKSICGCYTMDVIASVAFGMELDSMKNSENPFVNKARTIFSLNISKGSLNLIVKAFILFPGLMIPLVTLLTSSESTGPFKFFEEIVEQEIRRRQNKTVERPDFLQMIMHLEKDPKDPRWKEFLNIDEFGLPWLSNGLTHEEILAQAMLFFLAGYETTANQLGWVLFELSNNPECQQKLFEEISELMCDGDEMLSIDSLNEFKYLDNCINETLRKYSPTWRLERMCTKDTHLGGLAIPKGVTVNIPINALQKNPKYWHDPERFDPERFDNPDSIEPFTYLPFGMGNRNCIGMRLALLELKLALVKLLRKFEFSVSPETKLPFKWRSNPLRSSVNPIYLDVKFRQ